MYLKIRLKKKICRFEIQVMLGNSEKKLYVTRKKLAKYIKYFLEPSTFGVKRQTLALNYKTNICCYLT